MTRQKIQIKKIDNLAARQVTFSKRRRGVFKKAQELATLCDADIALIVFSASGKLFDYSSLSMQEMIRRHKMVQENIDNLSQPESQLEDNAFAKLTEEFANKTNELRRMAGQELQELGIEELKQLEKTLEIGLSRVIEAKDQKFLKEIAAAKEKKALLIEENERLRNQMKNLCREQEQLASNSSSSANPNSQDYDSSDISLKLGL